MCACPCLRVSNAWYRVLVLMWLPCRYVRITDIRMHAALDLNNGAGFRQLTKLVPAATRRTPTLRVEARMANRVRPSARQLPRLVAVAHVLCGGGCVRVQQARAASGDKDVGGLLPEASPTRVMLTKYRRHSSGDASLLRAYVASTAWPC